MVEVMRAMAIAMATLRKMVGRRFLYSKTQPAGTRDRTYWPSSVAKSAARELIDRLGSRCAQSRRRHRTWDIGFATTRLQSLVYNAQPGAVAYAETPDVLGLFAWLLRDQLLAKINAGFDEIADDKSALNQAQREEADGSALYMLAAERAVQCDLDCRNAEQ